MAVRPSPQPRSTSPELQEHTEPAESLAELTGEIRGLADYVRSIDARTAELQKAVGTKQRQTRPSAPQPEVTLTRYATSALALVVLIVVAAALAGLDITLQSGVLGS